MHTLVNKIGYPDKWRDYSKVVVKRGDFFGNVERAQAFESKRDLAKIGKPLDRGEWEMTPAHRQRLLRRADERHQLPRRRAAAPALRPEDGRRAQLRQHRRHHRPRAHPRLRRRGPQVRRQGQPARLVDGGRREGVRRAGLVHRRPVRQLRRRGRHQDQQQAHAGRGHRRPGRAHPRLDRVADGEGDHSRQSARRPHARAALLRGLRAVGLRERPPREPAREGDDRPALAGEISRERAGGEHARVRRGVLLQGRASR